MKLITKIEHFLIRMRWKAFWFERDSDKEQECIKENFGFKSNNVAPSNARLQRFEEEMYDMVRSIKFRKVENDFQKKLKNDVQEIRRSNKIFVHADKTTNIYKVTKDEYRKIVNENVTKNYKVGNNELVEKLNLEAKSLACNKQLEKRITKLAEKDAFITFKDHKPNFNANPKCRLINPAKSQIGRISKIILENINKEIRSKTGMNQWTNTAQALNWFKQIRNKQNAKLIKWDINEFYPSITEKLLMKALSFAKQFTEISQDDINTIRHASKSVLFHNSKTWVKKTGNSKFDIAMGSFHGAEVCELVGLYLLNKVGPVFGAENAGLYRDDGIAVVHNISGNEIEKINKKLHKIFKQENLSITIEAGASQTDFLDVTLDLVNDKYYPYRKPNDVPLYVHKQSNHPPSIVKQLPFMIQKRLSDLSSTESDFHGCKASYEQALMESGYKTKLDYIQKTSPKNKNRSRKIIWFNPPFDMSVATNVAKKFLSILDRNFPVGHRYRSIFNRNSVKVSYSCMDNIANIIQSKNKMILNSDKDKETELCNCRVKNNCPLKGKCKTSNVIYKATVKSNAGCKIYYGASETEFKSRYNNHTKSFKNETYRFSTELSKHVWNLKEKKSDFKIDWEIVRKVKPMSHGEAKCNLCLAEKFTIAMAKRPETLNKRSELMSKCRHSNKFLLKNV